MAPHLIHQFWGSNSDSVSQLLVREVILAEQVEVLPGSGRADSIGRTYQNDSERSSRRKANEAETGWSQPAHQLQTRPPRQRSSLREFLCRIWYLCWNLTDIIPDPTFMPATKISRKPLRHKDRAARAVRQILDSPSPTFQPPWSNANGWNYPQYFATMRVGDVDGDGKAELVGRGADGAQIWWFDTVAATWISLCINQCNWTDANGWGDVSRAQTLRLADVNGDDVCELIARNQTGLEVWQYDPSSGSCQLLVANGCNWTDAAGWNQPQYYSTILCADINGDDIAEIIGRGANGIEVWSCANGSWTQLAAGGCNWTDAAGWNQPQYYSTIRAADVNGDGLPELIGRGANGIEVWVFLTKTAKGQFVSKPGSGSV